MKKALLALLFLPSIALAAQQEITVVPASPVQPSIGALKAALNLRLASVQSNFDEIYTKINAGPLYVNASAPADTSVLWIDSDQDNALKAYIGGVWTVVGSLGGEYTLPAATDTTLGGVIDGAGVTIAGDGTLSADLQPVGDCTAGPCLDGSPDGGNMIKLWAGTGTNWTALQGGVPAANRSWRLPIAAPPAAGETLVMTMDQYGQMAFMAKPSTSGYVLSSTDAGVLSWAAPATAGGDDLGAATYSSVVGLWTTCTGYLKSDGTCDTPVGSAPSWLPANAPTADNMIIQATGGCSDPLYTDQATCEANSGTWTPPVGAWTSIIDGLINDAGTGTDDLLSASEINTRISSAGAFYQEADADLVTAAGADTAGASKYFGTNASSVVGFYDIPGGGSTQPVAMQQVFASSETLVAGTGSKTKAITGVGWTTADIGCDASDTLGVSVKTSLTINGTYTEIGTVSLTAAAQNTAVDISSWADISAGTWVRIDLTGTPAAATECTIVIEGVEQ